MLRCCRAHSGHIPHVYPSNKNHAFLQHLYFMHIVVIFLTSQCAIDTSTMTVVNKIRHDFDLLANYVGCRIDEETAEFLCLEKGIPKKNLKLNMFLCQS